MRGDKGMLWQPPEEKKGENSMKSYPIVTTIVSLTRAKGQTKYTLSKTRIVSRQPNEVTKN